jgi:4-hydroxy-2-oxoheptanedioate aldolase
MSTPHNLFKQALQQRQQQIGLWLALADSYSAELLANAGFDWLVIDGEHAPNDLRSTLSALQALAAYPVRPVVRLPHGDANLIKQMLELGAQTLLIPMVESAQQATELVRVMRYPPQGIRGVGSFIARSSRWGTDARYLHEANDEVCLLVQVETQSALQQLDAIVQTDGVDGVFIGPADLSASMGYLGESNHPDVVAAIEQAIRTIVAGGKAAGILCADEALARQYIAAGASFVAVGVDTSLLMRAARQLAEKFKEKKAAT